MNVDSLFEVAESPIEAAAFRSRARDLKVGLCFSGDFPLEVLDAFHLHAVCLPEVPREVNPRADALIQAYTCTFVRSCAEAVLDGSLHIGLVAGVSGCDALTGLPGILEVEGGAPPIAVLRLPIALGTPAALRQADRALLEFCRETESRLGRPLDMVELEAATGRRQAIRDRVLAEFDALAEGKGSQMRAYSWAIASRVLDPDEFERLAAVEDTSAAEARPGGVPILLSGSVLPSIQVIVDLEEMGVRVAVDDTDTGVRTVSRRVGPRNGNLLGAVASSLVVKRMNGPERFGNGGRVASVVARAQAGGVKAALLLLHKFCDPHAFEAPKLAGALRKAGIPTLVVEVDRQAGLGSRDRTSVEALLERLS
jgi:benzoyl-CoA reductase/2-hydroxyglutaryl-CoA dehydratase subunit BcrC/BadD/HgdB